MELPEAKDKLDDIITAFKHDLLFLSEWEENFINDVTDKGLKTDKQFEVVFKIWRRIK